MRRATVWAALLCAAAAAAAAAKAAHAQGVPCADGVDVEPIAKFCQELPKVCVDHGDYVLYDKRHNPRHPSYEGKLPQIRLDSVKVDYYGFGDAWKTEIAYPDPLVRPATSGEETTELQEPQFTSCTLPVVIYPSYLYNYGEFFARTVATLHAMQAKGYIGKRVTLALAALGMRLEPYHYFLLAPFTAWNVTSLAHLSSRAPIDAPEDYAPDARHVRCFRRLVVCQTNYFWKFGLEEPLWSAGQAVVAHYAPQLPPPDPALADARRLRVVIATRPLTSKAGTLVNQDQVWSWCSKFKPPSSVGPGWGGTSCLRHEFGRDALRDVSVASNADVLIGVHGPALFNAFFMPRRSSVVELRPRGFGGAWPDSYLKDMTSKDDKHSLFWWGVSAARPQASAPGALELEGRGDNATWPRDRHTQMRLVPLQYIFERLALARRDLDAYLEFRRRGEVHVDDEARAVPASARRRLLAAVEAALAAEGGSGGSGGWEEEEQEEGGFAAGEL